MTRGKGRAAKVQEPLWPKECRGRLASGESVIKSRLRMILADHNLIKSVDISSLHTVSSSKCRIVQAETDYRFLAMQRYYVLSSVVNRKSITFRGIGSRSEGDRQVSQRLREGGQRMSEHVRTAKFLQHIKPNISFLANAWQVCLSAAFDAHQRKCAMSCHHSFGCK